MINKIKNSSSNFHIFNDKTCLCIIIFGIVNIPCMQGSKSNLPRHHPCARENPHTREKNAYDDIKKMYVCVFLIKNIHIYV